ncbi:MAG: cadherin-like beta sandwich domain-containing protein [Lachnospiraceae bacterium]|nr:cadherin-like beta sandwich domain-containing protein [Lachnospiraceae bacterium]
MRVKSTIDMRKKQNRAALLLFAAMLWLCSVFASAESLSADNSLSSLGITTEGAVVSPEFTYGTTVYDVTVPAGTTSLSLSPTPSNSGAYIDSISGTELTDGATTVSIVVVAENGDAYTYYLNVTAEASETETETQTETEKQTETEAETEDSRYVSVARETLEEAENTISTLKSEISLYRDRVELLMKILYGMIALCVVLLFVVINLLLKNKDLKSDLRNYRGLNYSSGRRNPENEEEERPKKEPKQKKSKKKKEKAVIVEDTRHQQSREMDEGDAFDRTGRDTFYEQERQSQGRQSVDDPATVPKPSKARNQAKRMPEYEPLKERPRYEPSKEQKSGSEEVDIDYIDL